MTATSHQASTCRCGRLTRDAAYVCETCLDELSHALGEVPWLASELETTITRQRALPTEGGPGGTGTSKQCSCSTADLEADECPHTSLPWHEAAAEAGHDLRAKLVSWVLFCHEERLQHRQPPPIAGPVCRSRGCEHDTCDRIRRGDLPENTLAAMSRWLMWRVDALAWLDIGPEAVDEITAAVKSCLRLIDRRGEREFVGRCGCGRNLERRPGAKLVDCQACGRQYDAEANLELMREAIRDQLVTLTEALGLLARFDLPVKRKTAEKWHERKQLTARGHNLHGVRVYRFGDLLDLAAAQARPSAGPAHAVAG